MKAIVPSLLLGIVTVAPTVVLADTFYLHQSASPVVVPGGSTTTFLDQIAPAGATVAAKSISVSKKAEVSFPSFIAPGFGAPGVVGLDFDVTVNLSANLSMIGCASVGATVDRVAADGSRTPLAAGKVFGVTVPQGSAGGTAGFASVVIPFSAFLLCGGPFGDAGIGTGESIALTISVTNACHANRTVSLAFDAVSAQSRGDFASLAPLGPGAFTSCFGKCWLGEEKCASLFTTALLKCHQNAEKKGIPLDPVCVQKAADKFTLPPKGCIDKAEEKLVCSSAPVATLLLALQDVSVDEVVQALDPDFPNPVLSKCSALKKGCASTYVKGILACNEKATKPGTSVDPECIGKVTDKFTQPEKGCMEKAEAKAQPCPTNGDAVPIKAQLDAFVNAVVCTLQGPAICPSSPSGAFVDR
jgi:hypothetical protein